MKIRVPYYYKDFKCIAGECTDSCCAGWEVDLDDKAYDYYKTVQGAFGERLKSVMIDDEEGKRFRLNNGRCPFLNNCNLCDLYTELGEEKLCDTCTNYPRFIEEYGSLREIGIALSCKTAGELILGKSEKTTFVTQDTDEKVTSYNDINPELYLNLLRARKTAIAIAQSRKYNIEQRMQLILLYAEKIQKKISKGKYNKISEVIEKYSDEAYIENKIKKVSSKYKTAKYNKADKMLEYLKIYRNEIEIINEKWPQLIDKDIKKLHQDLVDEINDSENIHRTLEMQYIKLYGDFTEYYKDRLYEYEHLLVYFIYRYFLKAVNDKDILSKVKLGIVSYLIIKELDVLQWFENGGSLSFTEQVDIMHMYSREVEHSYENHDSLAKLYREHTAFRVKELMKILKHN